ncbi:MAG: hypothetical protein KDE59_19060 [Anaerolineales bacterium]|nr:hypothetical protein [Anaerolineales bacterium]
MVMAVMRKRSHGLWFLLVMLLLFNNGCSKSSGPATPTPQSRTEPVTATATITPAAAETTVITVAPATVQVTERVSTALPPTSPAPTATMPVTPIATLPPEAAFSPPYEYLELAELSWDRELLYVGWESNGTQLVYALTTPGIFSAEPKDWEWWRYDLELGSKERLEPVPSRVTAETRRLLDICPTEQATLKNQYHCPGYSRLLESPISDRIVFSPENLADGKVWLANLDGTGLVRLETPVDVASEAQWSSDGQWILISVHFPGGPGQMTHYLARADGSYETLFDDITHHDTFLLNGVYPQFSPDGTMLAYVGSPVYESFNRSDYHLFVLNLEDQTIQQLSDYIGLFQWSADNRGLYVLNDGLDLPAPFPLDEGFQEASLYYVSLSGDANEAMLIASPIPYSSLTDHGGWLGSYSPVSQALAYAGFAQNSFGILFFRPAEADE